MKIIKIFLITAILGLIISGCVTTKGKNVQINEKGIIKENTK